MTDQEDNINLGKNVFVDNSQEKESWACLGQACSRSLIVFLSQLDFIINFGCFWRIHLSKNCVESTVFFVSRRTEFFTVRRDTFYPHQDYEQVNFYRKSSLYFIGWSSRNWKIAAFLQLAKNWNISTKV